MVTLAQTKSKLRKNLSRNVRSLMVARDWSQADMARAAELTEVRVHNLFHGRHCPNVAAVAKIAAALGTTVDDLIH